MQSELFAIGRIVVGGEVEYDEANLCATVLGLNADDMHVAGRAGAQFDI